MFRYERPQMGRYRQFHQVGVEAFGYQGPDIEVEHILMMARFWEWMGISKQVELQINTLGSSEARLKYKAKLVEYFTQHKEKLDEDSQRRLLTNPLRILDSKNPDLKDLIAKAPKGYEYLDNEDKIHFEQFKERLEKANIAYKMNPCLVRGLDYYNRTVYEWVTDNLGAQGTLCAGGRYDGLVEQLGGQKTFGVGFALGIERVLLLVEKNNKLQTRKADVYLIAVSEAAEIAAAPYMEKLRSELPSLKFILHCGGGSFKNQFKRADKSGADLALILGEKEIDTQTIGIKFLRVEGEQQTLPQTDAWKFIANHFKVQQLGESYDA
jgi:histidyl-tRNA synthetase